MKVSVVYRFNCGEFEGMDFMLRIETLERCWGWFVSKIIFTVKAPLQ